MSELCDHSKYSTSYDDCHEPGHPEDCVVSKCDNCNTPVEHDLGVFPTDGTDVNRALGQQFRDVVYFGGASDSFKDVTTNCEDCGITTPKETAAKNGGICDDCSNAQWSQPIDDEHEPGYRCRVCNKWFETDDENMNHRCFE